MKDWNKPQGLTDKEFFDKILNFQANNPGNTQGCPITAEDMGTRPALVIPNLQEVYLTPHMVDCIEWLNANNSPYDEETARKMIKAALNAEGGSIRMDRTKYRYNKNSPRADGYKYTYKVPNEYLKVQITVDFEGNLLFCTFIICTTDADWWE